MYVYTHTQESRSESRSWRSSSFAIPSRPINHTRNSDIIISTMFTYVTESVRAGHRVGAALQRCSCNGPAALGAHALDSSTQQGKPPPNSVKGLPCSQMLGFLLQYRALSQSARALDCPPQARPDGPHTQSRAL